MTKEWEKPEDLRRRKPVLWLTMTALFMAMVAWKLCRKDQPLLALLSFLLAEAVMVLGYFLLEWALYGVASAAAAIGPNVVQGIAGVLIGMLCLLITPRLERVAKV